MVLQVSECWIERDWRGIKMYSIRTKILQRLPSRCPLCGLAARGGDLCLGCAHDLALATDTDGCCPRCLERLVAGRDVGQGPQCQQCLHAAPAYTRTVAAIRYGCPGELLIHRFKEGGRLAYAGLFARLLWSRLQRDRVCALAVGMEVSALVPIPASAQALRRRGFNPAAELARELSWLSGWALQPTWLTRTRDSLSQKTLGFAERRRSVQGLYCCTETLPPVWVGVVDDVMTTGSTMRSAAENLLAAGAVGVVALAAAHTPRIWQNGAHD